jgi:putative two-component system hydrogenase maturation factor HypX/HoxX
VKILLLAHSFNSLTQRLFVELRARGHQVTVEFDIADSVAEEAVALFRPDLIVAPYLRRAIPASIWRRHVCLVVHPGIVGDRGPSALDWAILEGEEQWGVTVLQANAEMDAGDVWSERTFPMRRARKGSLYRNEVSDHASRAVLDAVARFETGAFRPRPQAEFDPAPRGHPRPLMRQPVRAIDWQRDSTDTVMRKLDSADGFPGVLDRMFGVDCHLFDGHPERELGGLPGEILAQRDGALLRATVDGAVWIGQAKRLDRRGDDEASFKLPAAVAFEAEAGALAHRPAPLQRGASGGWGELRYHEESGGAAGRVGFLHFDFYNGAAGTAQCERLLQAYEHARSRPTRVIVLMGGADFWCNGIHLNLIEAAPSPADESWRNINAIDDLARAIIETDTHLTVAAMRGNAGAGGVFLALAADHIWAREGVILNPHYRNMGNLYGSEYWTYLLPRRAGQAAESIMRSRLPVSAPQAQALGLVDACLGGDVAAFERAVAERARELAQAPDLERQLLAKRERRASDEAQRPLAAYREHELIQMRRNFYGFDPSYHVARAHFVRKLPLAWTPRHLALHRGPASPSARAASADG